jgi:Rubredoxin-like zinc ribbon domain (DUF35_N)
LDFSGVEEGEIMRAPEIWRNQKVEYGLWGEICPYCDELIFPPRDICPGVGCGKNTFTLPLTTREERKYYGEKGVIIKEQIRSTRIDLGELFGIGL